MIILLLILVTASGLSAQTPVKKIVLNYEYTKGAFDFISKGLKMTLARNLMKSTELAPVASYVDELYVLKMDDASQSDRLQFLADLNEALTCYEYYGKQPSKNGEVEVYVHYAGMDSIDELVIFNPATYSLFSLYGRFPVQKLKSLARDPCK